MKQYLLATNGAEESRAALTYGLRLAQVQEAFVTLLGVTEPSDAHHPLQPVLAAFTAELQQAGVPYRVHEMNGYAEQVVAAEAAAGEYDLLCLGPLGRPALRRWLLGRSLRYFLEEVQIPILYAPTLRWPLKRILVCLGGLGYARPAEQFALETAQAVGAQVTLLHVVPPIVRSYPLAEKIRADWEHVQDTDTIIGRSLRAGLGLAAARGVEARLRVRHGEVIEEILAEVRETAYDLVCMGSPYSAHGLRARYAPNVTAEVAEHGGTPVYCARSPD